MHCSQDSQLPYLEKKKFKIGPTALFTHLKMILLQCFQFLVFSKINYIQTGPMSQDLFTMIWTYLRGKAWMEVSGSLALVCYDSFIFFLLSSWQFAILQFILYKLQCQLFSTYDYSQHRLYMLLESQFLSFEIKLRLFLNYSHEPLIASNWEVTRGGCRAATQHQESQRVPSSYQQYCWQLSEFRGNKEIV